MKSTIVSLSLAPMPSKPLFEQLYDGLKQSIVEGQLIAGTRLPASRALAQDIGVSRSTVITAYDQLQAEGFIEGRAGSGMYVTDMGDLERQPHWPRQRANTVVYDSAKDTFQHPPVCQAFSAAKMDDSLFPHGEWGRCVARTARTKPQDLLRKTHPFGHAELRTQICMFVRDWRGIHTTPDNVIVTAGSEEALDICLALLTKGGETIALEDPCYRSFLRRSKTRGLHLSAMPVDDSGATVPSDVAVKLAAVTPSSQFPLGGAMSHLRRMAFLDWAVSEQAYVIEDDYDSEFRFAGRPIPALASLDISERVLYVGTFSMALSKDIRVGYVILPSHLRRKATLLLEYYGLAASVMPHAPIAAFMESGGFVRHIRRTRRIYAARRVHLINIIRKVFQNQLLVKDHRAGMHLVALSASPFDDVAAAKVSRDSGITVNPISRYFWCASPDKYGFLMGFGAFAPDIQDRAMAQFYRCVKPYLP